MIVDLNISLDIRNARNSVVDCTKRAVLALDYLFDQFGPLQARRYDHQVECDFTGDLLLRQDLIVRLSVPANDMRKLRLSLFILTNLLEQDCIAMFVPSQERGELIGERSGQWREGFDYAMFTDFSAAPMMM